MDNGAEFIKQATGAWPVYPGHPLVLATAIMAVFPDFKTAIKPTEHGWSVAHSDSRIPGAGDHVGAAMSLLRLGSEGLSTEQMIDYGKRYWERGQAGGHVDHVQAGIEQAEAIESAFRQLAAEWCFSQASTEPASHSAS